MYGVDTKVLVGDHIKDVKWHIDPLVSDRDRDKLYYLCTPGELTGVRETIFFEARLCIIQAK
jgi:hypothetical protein